MGIDVFGVFEAKEALGWRYLKSYYCGRRGALRWWLGWGTSGLHKKFGVQPLVDDFRGLPSNYSRNDSVGSQCQSWVLDEEVLGAMPLLGRYTYAVPKELARSLWDQRAPPEQWKAMTGISDELDFLKRYDGSPRLVGVTPQWQSETDSETSILIDCVYDFSYEIREFTSEVETLRKQCGTVRFVYGFE